MIRDRSTEHRSARREGWTTYRSSLAKLIEHGGKTDTGRASAMSKSSYKLSSVLLGHSADVRAVATFLDGTVVSASRDKTARVWRPTGLVVHADSPTSGSSRCSKFLGLFSYNFRSLSAVESERHGPLYVRKVKHTCT